jgi:dihydroorotase
LYFYGTGNYLLLAGHKMQPDYHIINARIINEGEIYDGSVLIENQKIAKIIRKEEMFKGKLPARCQIIDANGKYLIPGVIDEHVHFREPGLTHKGDIYTESKAAIAGGVTSFMDMPNTSPQTLTQNLLEKKYDLAAKKSLANFSFYIGASKSNLDEILEIDPGNVCGVKVFMGASTGNMLVDDPDVLNAIFSRSGLLVAVHCEDENIIRQNSKTYREEYGEYVPLDMHPFIRSEDACYESSSLAVKLARKYGTRLHVLHLSTARELGLFDNQVPLNEKKITVEVCTHHLLFSDEDYSELGTRIKWNPAIKSNYDREALLEALKNDFIDVIATDHAPHTLKEKMQSYFNIPSGGPMVQHSLVAMLELHLQGKIPLAKIVEKMCHAPAVCFQIGKRGFIREGYWADLVIFDLKYPWIVDNSNILYKCGWSPFEGVTFGSKVTHTFVNGHLVYHDGIFNEQNKGKRLTFER